MLILKAPPVRPCGNGDAVCGDLVGNFISLKRVMEGADLVAEFLGHFHFGKELIGAIAMDLHQQLAPKNVSQRFQLQVFLGRRGVFVAFFTLAS